MTPTTRTRLSHARQTMRQREVRQCLARFGFGRAAFRLWKPRQAEPDVKEASRCLGTVLETLGPVFTAFGVYLASRTDLLPPVVRATLARCPEIEPLSFRVVRALLAEELGGASAEKIAALERSPRAVGLLHQCHNAQLHDGTPVVVKVLRPQAEDDVTGDLELLPLLRVVFAGDEEREQDFERAVADFLDDLALQEDLVHEARALEALAHDTDAADLLRVPGVYGDLSTPRLLTVERLAGWSLRQIVSPAEGKEGLPPPVDLDRSELTTRFCTVWLRQALLGSFFPAEPEATTTLVLADGRLVFTGVHAALTWEVKRALWDYLLAVIKDDPEGEGTHLARVLERCERPVGEEQLCHLFRQAVLFGEGEEEGLAELLRMHQRLASAHGWEAPAPLRRFYRGLDLVHATAKCLAPERDSLRDGLENVRTQAAIRQLRDLLSTVQLDRNLERFAPVLLDLPRRLDESLSLLADGGARINLRVRETAELRRRRNGAARRFALLLVLAALALLGHHLSETGAVGAWVVPVSASVFLLVGGCLLQAMRDSD